MSRNGSGISYYMGDIPKEILPELELVRAYGAVGRAWHDGLLMFPILPPGVSQELVNRASDYAIRNLMRAVRREEKRRPLGTTIVANFSTRVSEDPKSYVAFTPGVVGPVIISKPGYAVHVQALGYKKKNNHAPADKITE